MNRTKSKTLLKFMCYEPQIYSGLDKFNVLLAQKLIDKNIQPVFIYIRSLEKVPELESDLIAAKASLEFLSGYNFSAKEIWRLYKKYTPEITHTHFVNKAKILTAFFSWIWKAKHFSYFGSEISSLTIKNYKKQKGIIKRFAFLIYLNFLILFSNKVFTVSNKIKFQLSIFAHSNSSKIITLYNGIFIKKNEMSLQEIKDFLHLKENKILISNISAIEPLKGIDVILKAISVLKEKYNFSNFIFCHIGGLRGNNKEHIYYEQSLKELVQQLNLDENVLWLGKRNDIHEIMSAFDIYVHPSRSEGLGFANMEAAVQCLPIIGSNIGGIPEIVHNGINGFLFESENIEELAEYLYKLIVNEELRIKMGQESFRIVNVNFNIDIQTNKLIDYYLKIK